MALEIHVTPIVDWVEHKCSGGAKCDCACEPDVQLVREGVLVLHQSFASDELAANEYQRELFTGLPLR